MRGERDATQGKAQRWNGRDGDFWSGSILAGSALAALVGCTNEIQPCPDVLDSSLDVPSGLFAPAEGRHLDRQVGAPLFIETFPHPAVGLAAYDGTLSADAPPYDASAFPGPAQFLPSATLTIDRGLGLVTRSYMDEEGRLVEEHWRFKWAP